MNNMDAMERLGLFEPLAERLSERHWFLGGGWLMTNLRWTDGSVVVELDVESRPYEDDPNAWPACYVDRRRVLIVLTPLPDDEWRVEHSIELSARWEPDQISMDYMTRDERLEGPMEGWDWLPDEGGHGGRYEPDQRMFTRPLPGKEG